MRWNRLQHESAGRVRDRPVKIGAGWIERLVGEKCNSGSVFTENRKRVVKMKLSVEVGNVWSPEFLGGRTRCRIQSGIFRKPNRRGASDGDPETTYGEFSFSVRPIGGTEQIPGITILGDGRIVVYSTSPSSFRA